jgi:hypothetical protein
MDKRVPAFNVGRMGMSAAGDTCSRTTPLSAMFTDPAAMFARRTT